MSIYDLEGYTIDELAMIEQGGVEIFYNRLYEPYKFATDPDFYKDVLGIVEWPKIRKEAKQLGCRYYKREKCCPKGHESVYLTISGGCRECVSENYRNLSDEEKKARYQYKKQYGKKKNFRTEKYRQKQREYREKNREKVRETSRKYYREVSSKDLNFRLHANVSSGMAAYLSNRKQGKTWLEYVDFTIEELKSHLEKQFTPEMNWDNYGSYWHIDHIKPKSLCESFEEAWQLSNLQPLTAFDNMSKHNRYIGHPDNPQWVKKQDKNNDNNI